MPVVDQILDGYRLIRRIGSGGFGEVWLCCLGATGEHRALKFIPQDRLRHLDRELQALTVYRREIERGATNYLIAIEHVNRYDTGLFYVMPLADGPAGMEIADERWKPVTLDTIIETHRTTGQWFTVEEIARIFGPLAMAAQALAEAGLVHRDIKPQNILFFGGLPRLADIGLVSVDDAELSEMGTPGYVAPQWYLASHGNPDMWGLAATLYHTATGNHPDYMSRPAYRWPPKGKAAMTAMEQRAWLALIGVAYRATQGNSTGRYVQFRDMASALELLSVTPADRTLERPLPGSRKFSNRVVLTLLAAGLLVLLTVAVYRFKISRVQERHAAPSAVVTPASAFTEKLESARADFESLLAATRHATLGDHPPQHDRVDDFRALIEKLGSQTDAPMTEIRETFARMEPLGPSLREELRVIDNRTLNDGVERLYAAANLPRQLANNAEEGFRAGKISDDLLAETSTFQDAASAWNTSVYGTVTELESKLHDAASKLDRGRTIHGPVKDDLRAVQAERNEIYRLAKGVLKKTIDPILTPG